MNNHLVIVSTPAELRAVIAVEIGKAVSQRAPRTVSPRTSRTGLSRAARTIRHEGGEWTLSPHQFRLYSALRQRAGSSTVDLVRTLRIADPRATIRDLRKAGIAIGDVWCRTPEGLRYKRYFLRKEAGDGQQ